MRRARGARALVAVIALATGLGTSSPVAGAPAQPDGNALGASACTLEPLEPRVVLPMGQRAASNLVVPVRSTGAQPPATVRLALSDGTPVDARCLPVDLVQTGPSSEAEAWTGLRGQWVIGDVAGDPGSLRREWLLVVDAAAISDAATLTLPGGASVAIDRLTDAEAGAAVLARVAARLVEVRAGEPPFDPARFATFLAPALRTPSERWRARALMRAIDPASADVGPGGAGTVRSTDAAPDALGALADQTERRWHAALGRLAAIDDALAARVAESLLLCVRFEGGVLAPLWPDASPVNAQLGAMLDPASELEAVRLGAIAWLAAQPPALAWVIDDAGRPLAAEDDGDRAARPRIGARVQIGLVNLHGAPAVAWVSQVVPGAPDDAGEPDEPLLIAAHGAITADVPVTVTRVAARDAIGPRAAVLRVRIGELQSALAARVLPLPAALPGATLGPLVQDWSMASLRAGQSAPPAAPASAAEGARADAWLTAARLTREGDQWVLLVQCNYPAAQPIDADRLEVWLGRAQDAAPPLRIGPAQPPPPADGAPAPISRTLSPDGAVGSWWATVPVPASAIEADGTLRLGLVRTDARTVRSAWPRAMLPWQTEPGRAAIDTRAWDMGGP